MMKTTIRRTVTAATVSVGLSMGLGLGATPALAAPTAEAQAAVARTTSSSPSTPTSSRFFAPIRVVDVKRDDRPAASGIEVGRCTVYTAGGTCSIDRSRSLSVSVQGSLGATVQSIANQLGIALELGSAVSVSCGSPALAAGQSWVARAGGTSYTYRVERTSLFGGKTVSAPLRAFVPRANAVVCSAE